MERMMKRISVMMLTLMVCISMMPFEAFANGSTEGGSSENSSAVNYIDSDGSPKSVTNYARVKSDKNMTDGTGENAGWYVLDENQNFTNRLKITGNVRLILCNGKTLTASMGIYVPGNSSLEIFAQTKDGNMGKIVATAGSREAGIGGNEDESNGPITINGGDITATGGKYATGIGGGDEGHGGGVTINGGKVKATGGYQAAGIGGGDKCSAGSIKITGGEVTATGGQKAAGIGGGRYGNAGSISITGGNVTAESSYGGAGIGSGRENSGSSYAAQGKYKGGEIRIGGDSRIHASAGKGIYELRPSVANDPIRVDADDGGAGIGSGRESYGTNVELSGKAYVTVTNSPGDFSYSTKKFSENSACIGTGYDPETAGRVYINGSDSQNQPKIDAMMDYGTNERDSDYDAQAIGYGDDGDAGCEVAFDYQNAMVFSGNADSASIMYLAKMSERYDRLRQHRRDIYGHYRTVRIAPCTHPGVTFEKGETYHSFVCEYCGNSWNAPHEFVYEHDSTDHWQKCTVCGYKTEKSKHSAESDSSNKCVCGIEGKRIRFNAGGGSGSMESVWFVDRIKFTYPECGFTPPAGQSFIGWSTDGTTESLHTPGTYDYISDNRTLKALYSASWSDLQKQINVASDGDTITIGSHYYGSENDKPLTITKKITIDLNGFELDKRSGYSNQSEAIRVKSGAELTIKDSSTGQKGKVTGGASMESGGGIVVESGAKLTLQSGSIYNNSATKGAGVYVDGGEFTMSGGSITGNLAQESGSAVHVGSGSFIMTGGSISGNTGLKKTAGAVTVDQGSFKVSGSPVIGGNNCFETAAENNVYLDKAGIIGFDDDPGALDADARISVTPAEALSGKETLAVTSGFSRKTVGGENYRGALSNFVSSNGDYVFGLNDSGEVIMGSDKVTVSFAAGEGATGSMSDITALNNAGIILPACGFTAPADEGQNTIFEGWLKGDDTEIVHEALSRVMISGDTKFTAKWINKADQTFRITVSAGEGGRAYAARTAAKSGEVVGIFAEPQEGYTFKKWTATDATVDKETSASAQLTMGSAAASVSAEFEEIKVTGISLDKTELEMTVGRTEKLTASIVPYNAKNKSVTWSVVPGGSDVVEVNDGNVTAKNPGSATVRVMTADGSYTADCRVVVAPQYTVTFTDGGTEVKSVILNEGEKLAKPEDPTKENYKFLGWKLVTGETVSSDYYDFSRTVSSDLTLKAEWEHVHNSSTLTKYEAVAPKCEAGGHSEYWECDVCNKYYADDNGKDEISADTWVIPALGHKWGEWKEDGAENHKRTCMYDPGHTETAAHRWNNGEITKAPTYGEAGEKTYTCIDCGRTYTEPIDRLEENDIGISVSKIGGGFVYASASKGKYLDQISISAEAAEGYRFSKWEQSGAKATIANTESPNTTLTIDATQDQHGVPVTIKAIFDIDISKGEAELSETEFVFSGKTQRPKVISVGEGDTERAFSEDVFDLEWSDPDSKDAGNYYVTIKGKGNGTNGLPVGKVRANYRIARSGVEIPSGRTLTYNGWPQNGVAGSDMYTVKDGVRTDAGSYTATVSLNDKKNSVWSDGTTEDKKLSYVIRKADNPLSVSAKTAKVKYKKLKKKNQKLAAGKVIKFTRKGQGRMTYKKVSGSKKITIAKTTGKVTVKKGLKKGTYKVKVKVKAAGNGNYKASAWKTVTFRVRVK
ncbi:MAG: InlB B-repeat-containing protein [Mogibacterium sp.]|nr:InlB B-repeat-containing protein [Mogibacterium sp.]